jgi:hypothetical protein
VQAAFVLRLAASLLSSLICRKLVYIGYAADADILPLHWNTSQWGCLAQLPAPSSAEDRPDYTLDNTLRFVVEPPLIFSTLSYAFSEQSATCRYPVQAVAHASQSRERHMTSDECKAQLESSSSCYQQQLTQVCAPMEPMYGAAVLPIPGAGSFVILGGRAALKQINDLEACKQPILDNSAWRFQYHRELEAQVLASSDGIACAHTSSSVLLVCQTSALNHSASNLNCTSAVCKLLLHIIACSYRGQLPEQPHCGHAACLSFRWQHFWS